VILAHTPKKGKKNPISLDAGFRHFFLMISIRNTQGSQNKNHNPKKQTKKFAPSLEEYHKRWRMVGFFLLSGGFPVLFVLPFPFNLCSPPQLYVFRVEKVIEPLRILTTATIMNE
jgi:hypothetical protein